MARGGKLKALISYLALGIAVLGASPVGAQTAAPETPWSIVGNLGWDNPISGNLIDGAIGTVTFLPAVVEPHSYGDEYGGGLTWRLGVGYMLGDDSEVLGTFTYAVASGEPISVGTLGGEQLFMDFSDYQQLDLEAGYRRYFSARNKWRPYGGASLGLAFVDRVQTNLTAPNIGAVLTAVDFYDNTTAFTVGFNGGVLYEVNERVGVGGEIGLKWRSGLSGIEGLAGTGLEKINDNSDRWSLPITFTARVRF
jgi:hypothetical protein